MTRTRVASLRRMSWSRHQSLRLHLELPRALVVQGSTFFGPQWIQWMMSGPQSIWEAPRGVTACQLSALVFHVEGWQREGAKTEQKNLKCWDKLSGFYWQIPNDPELNTVRKMISILVLKAYLLILNISLWSSSPGCSCRTSLPVPELWPTLRPRRFSRPVTLMVTARSELMVRKCLFSPQEELDLKFELDLDINSSKDLELTLRNSLSLCLPAEFAALVKG